MIGETVTWVSSGTQKAGVILAEIPKNVDVKRILIATPGVIRDGEELLPDKNRDALKGARFCKIGSVRSGNARVLVDVDGIMYAPRLSTIMAALDR